MKTIDKLIKKVLSPIILLAILLTIPFAPIKQVNADYTGGVDFRSGMVKYVLTDALQENPNTFECWLQIAENEKGHIGAIFSNACMMVSPMVGYSVNSNGNLCVEWNGYEKNVIFDEVDLRNGKWTHVAVVRNFEKGGFSLYVNGKLAQEVICGVGQDIEEFYQIHAIGCDYYSRQKEKYPFKGKIRQLTLYSDSLSSGEITRDYNNSNAISASTRQDLLLNVKLSPSDVVAEDNSMYKNNAYLGGNDYFYEDELFEAKDYTFAVVPDIQMITLFHPEMVGTLPDYLLKIEQEQKVEAVFTVGDLTNGKHSKGSSFDKQYKRIRDEFAKLDGHMPYIFTPGNHDYDDECGTNGGLTYLNKYLTHSKISQWEEWGGSYSDDKNLSEKSVVNAYYLLEHAGVKYIVFALDFGPTDDVLEWCCEVTERYLDRRLIFLTHSFIQPDSRLCAEDQSGAPEKYGWVSNVKPNCAEKMWDKWLKKYPNVFMTFSGHVITDDIVLEERVGDNGNVVANFLVNGQGVIMNDGLESLVALLNFDEQNQLVYFNYVSTIQEKQYNFQNQFVYDFGGNTQLVSTNYSQTSVTNKAPSRASLLNSITTRIGYFGNQTQAQNSNGWIIPVVYGIVLVGALATVIIIRAKKQEVKDENK